MNAVPGGQKAVARSGGFSSNKQEVMIMAALLKHHPGCCLQWGKLQLELQGLIMLCIPGTLL